jgi:hypothetical protein
MYFHKLKRYIVTCMSDSRRGFELDIGFIHHLTQRITTIHKSLSHTDQCSQSVTVSTSCFLVTASNSGDSLASVLTAPTTSSLHRLPYNSLSASTD